MVMTQDVNRGTWKDRLEYFWMYYKIPVILIAIGAVMAISFIHASFTQKPEALNVLLLDAHMSVSDDAAEDNFIDYEGIDTKENSVTINATQMLSDSTSASYQMGSLAKLYSEIGTEKLDVCSMLESDFSKYTGAGTFLDLRDLFTEEELNAFPSLYRDEEGRVLGIYCDDMPKMEEFAGYSSENAEGVIGIIYNTEHLDMAKTFLQYLNGQEKTGG